MDVNSEQDVGDVARPTDAAVKKKDLQQLKKGLDNTERELRISLSKMKVYLGEEVADLEEAHEDFLAESNRQKIYLQKSIANIQGQLQELHSLLLSRPSSAEEVKTLVEAIAEEITHLKREEKEICCNLAQEEQHLTEELKLVESRFEHWSNINDNHRHPQRLASVKLSEDSRTLPDEVIDFEKFLCETGGHSGGWETVDHLVFLRIRRRHLTNTENFMKEACSKLVTKTKDDVQAHLLWYEQYSDKLEKKKAAIQKWKTAKENEKEEVLLLHSKITSSHKDMQKVRNQKKVEIMEWKSRIDAKKAAEDAEKKKAMLENEMKKSLERLRQIELHRQVEEYQQKKREQMLDKERIALEQLKEQQTKSQLANSLLPKFQERDQERLQKKLEMKKVLEELVLSKEEKLKQMRKKMAPATVRDPARVLKPTKGWEHRLNAEEISQGMAWRPALLDSSRRAVPMWRRGWIS